MKIKLNGKIMEIGNWDFVYNANGKHYCNKVLIGTYKYEGYLNGKKLNREKGLNIFASVKKLNKDEKRRFVGEFNEEMTNYWHEKEKKQQTEKGEMIDSDGNFVEFKSVKTLIRKRYPEYMIGRVEVSKSVYDKFIKARKERKEFVLDLDK